MTIRPIIITLIIVTIAAYSVFESRNIFLGAAIDIYEPSTGMTVNDEVVIVRGSLKNTAGFSINGRSGTIDHTGTFEEQVVLLEGRNTIKIQAEDRFNRKTEKLIELIYQETKEVVIR